MNRLLVILKSLRCVVRPAVSREEAVRLAREAMGSDNRDATVRVTWGPICYTVFFDPGLRPQPFVKIDKRDGRVHHVGIPLR